MNIIIDKNLELEASEYALMSRSFTSDRHDFHSGGLSEKQKKMFEGKLGEKAIKKFFIDNNIKFIEDKSSHEEADFYDFLVFNEIGQELKVDVKTRTQSFHIRTLEMVEQFIKKPKDIYISVKLNFTNPFTVDVVGFALKEDLIRINRIQNLGYLDNYVLFDNELKKINLLTNLLQKNEK